MRHFLKSSLLLAAFAAPAAIIAQTVDISPVPQSAQWGQKAFDRPETIRIDGASNADADAVALLRGHYSEGGKKAVKIRIGERGDKSVAKYAAKIPARPEGYYLSVTPDGVVIAGNDEKGTFYGVQTFLKVASQPEVMSVEISDWPVVADRGVVEGFYGNPWSLDDRLHQFDFYGANKLNTYIYGPKDDPYHHAKWREPYPEDRAKVMQQMAEAARKNKVWFVWAMHPSNSIETAEDRQAAIDKLEKMYDLGFRSFAIFFDDISDYDATKQADYLNFLTDNFVHKHNDVTPLIMCPSAYNKLWAGDNPYLPTLGEKAYPEIKIMWTGNSVVDMINREDCEWVAPRIKRNPFIWLNWPVNDYCVSHLLMGPLYGNDVDIADMVSGFTLNPMEYAEASLVSLYQGADYLWNPSAYDSEKSWLNAVESLAPEGLAPEFLTFCKYNIDLGPNTHRLRREEESPELRMMIEAFNDSSVSTVNRYGLARQMFNEFTNVRDAAIKLLATSDTDRLTSEIRPWLVATELIGSRGRSIIEMYEAIERGDSVAAIEAYADYAAMTDSASRLESRNFPGSIKVAYPVSGSLYAEPFIRGFARTLSDTYKSKYSYRADILPTAVLPNGVYRIMANGKYLGNPQAGSVGGYPVLEDKEDDVNPDRQLWRVTLNPVTERYEIVNAKDRRYINERGAFAQNAKWNPFEPEWHTYEIEVKDGKYAIRNGGLAGKKYWGIEGERIVQGGTNDGPDNYIFEFVSGK